MFQTAPYHLGFTPPRPKSTTPRQMPRSPRPIRFGQVERPVYIPPPIYKYSLAKSPKNNSIPNNFEPQTYYIQTPSTQIKIGS